MICRAAPRACIPFAAAAAFPLPKGEKMRNERTAGDGLALPRFFWGSGVYANPEELGGTPYSGGPSRTLLRNVLAGANCVTRAYPARGVVLP